LVLYSNKATARPTPCPMAVFRLVVPWRFCIRLRVRGRRREAERYWMGGKQAGRGLSFSWRDGARRPAPLYSRFWAQGAFRFLGHVSKPSPFQLLFNQGLILGRRQPQNVECVGHCHRSTRCHRPSTRSRTLSLSTNVHGPARADEAVALKGVKGLSLSRPLLAFASGTKISAWRWAVITSWVQDVSGPRKSAAKNLQRPRL